jgi:transposase
MNGARFVHDRLELAGWQVEIADAHKVKGLAPLACKTDRIDAWVLAELARRDLVPAIWLPDPLVRAERERARWRLHLVRHRSSLKQRVHAVLLTHGKPCPVSDLFALRGRQLLARLELPEPWQGTIEASLRLIDELDREITDCERQLRRLGAEHRYVPLPLTVPGISWVLAYTIAAELGDINRFPTPRKLTGYTGLCPGVYQSGERDLRGRLAKQGPRYLRWAVVEAATHACTHPIYRERARKRRRASASSAAPRSPRSISRAGCPKRSGTCSTATSPSLPKAPRPPGRLTVPKERRHQSELQSALSSPRGGDREMSPARDPPPQHPP